MSDSIVPDNVKPLFWDEASAHLMGRDRILKKLIPQHRTEWLAAPGTPFVTLARAIVGQQISVSAANTQWARFIQACGRTPRRAPSSESRAGIREHGPVQAQGRIHSRSRAAFR